jgi:RNA polymerase sigma-70 factor (ECF subfamily)
MVLKTDDIHLVSAAQRGDLIAFELLVRRYGTPAYRIALRILGNPSDAEDVTQDSLLQAWQALPTLRDRRLFSTWLYRIVTNRCLNSIRARRATEVLPNEIEDETRRPNHVTEARRQLEALARAITRLTPEQRAPFVLRELEGLSYGEIAAVLETTVPAVKGRLHRARLALLEAMREWR